MPLNLHHGLDSNVLIVLNDLLRISENVHRSHHWYPILDITCLSLRVMFFKFFITGPPGLPFLITFAGDEKQ